MIPESSPPTEPTDLAHVQSDWWFRVMVILLTAASLVPIWGFTYFPSQDGPAHLENAWMLRHWSDAGRDFGEYYALNLRPVPNWAGHLTLALLMVVFPPLLAEKVMLTGYVLLFVAAGLYLLGGVSRRHRLFVLLAIPFAYHLLFMKGFWNFAISVPVLFLVLGFWWRRRERPLDRRLAVPLNLLLVLLYFCHLVSAVIGIGCLLIFLGLRARMRPGVMFRGVVALAPAAVLPVWFLAGRHLGVADGAAGLTLRESPFIDLFVALEPRGGWVAIGLFALMGGLMFRTLVREKLRRSGGRLRLKGDLRDGFLVAAALLAGLACFVPAGMAGGSLLDLRLALFAPLLILPWLAADLGPRARFAVGAAAFVLATANLSLLVTPFSRLQTQLDEYVSGVPRVGKNQTILPINLIDHRGLAGSRVSALMHAVSYYCVKSGAINLDNYEALTDYFPLRYHASRNPYAWIGNTESGLGLVKPDHYPVPVDFLLVRCPRAVVPGLPDAFRRYPPMRRIMRRYRLVHARGDVWLFARRGTAWPPRVERLPDSTNGRAVDRTAGG